MVIKNITLCVTPSSTSITSYEDFNKILQHRKNKLNHVLYEIQMFLVTKDYFYNYNHGDIITTNILWTSCMTHMRSLIYFFSEEGRKKDIHCSDIISDCSSLILDRNQVDTLSEDIHKSISHLTNQRTNEEFNSCLNEHLYTVALQVTKLITTFMERLPTCLIHDDKSNYFDDNTLSAMQYIDNLLVAK